MSKKAFKQARHSIINFVKTFAKEKSFATQATIRERLTSSIKDLNEAGYPIRNINNIQSKHIDALVKYWNEKELSIGTIKNKMSDFRFVAKSINKEGIIKATNREYDIPSRSFVPDHNKAIHEIDLNKFEDKYIQSSIELQKEFGLRREECIKIVPSRALITTQAGVKRLYLESTWTKGGISRYIEITNDSQLKAIEKAIDLTNGKSLIPEDKSYIQQRRFYDKVTREQGYYNLHGLRHAYAQKRYLELTGWKSPIAGGPAKSELSESEKKLDKKARLKISQELGHSRIEIAKNYIG